MPFDCTKLITEPTYYTEWESTVKTRITSLQGGTGSAESKKEMLITVQNEMQSATQCILNEINKLGTSSTDIAILQQQILSKTTALANAEKDISLAKDRAAYIRHPEQHTSNYESWFPIDRPIHSLSLIILVALSIFLGVFYILMMLSAFDIDLIFYTAPNYAISPTYIWIRQQLTLSFWLVLIVLISVVIYFVKRN